MNSPLDNKNTAIISLAWPFVIARGPEKIWVFLKKIGLMNIGGPILIARHTGFKACFQQIEELLNEL